MQVVYSIFQRFWTQKIVSESHGCHVLFWFCMFINIEYMELKKIWEPKVVVGKIDIQEVNGWVNWVKYTGTRYFYEW